jgi:hypothetical protein
MGRNDSNVQSATGVADGSDFIVDGSGSGTGAVEIGELGGTGGADIYREVDPDGDGTFEVSVLIDQVSTNWHTQINGLVVSSSENTRIRVNNTSGGAADFYAVGMEVDD